jgi:predicted ester cyclase
VTIQDLIASGEKVVARLHWVGTDASGTAHVRETIDILHLPDGRVVEHWGAAIMNDLPPPAG